MSPADRETHRPKVEKHTRAVGECESRGRTSIVTTNLSAVLLKFPDGAGLAGHRISTMAAGVQARLVVAALVSADTNDYGLIEPIVEETEGSWRRLVFPATAIYRFEAGCHPGEPRQR